MSLIHTALCRIRHRAVHAERRFMPHGGNKRIRLQDLVALGSA
jgi:hypothetical protein